MRHHHLRRALLGASAVALSGSLLVGCGSESGSDPGSQSGSESPATEHGSSEAAAAAAWLAGQLEDGVMNTSYEAEPGSGEWTTMADHGLALDVLFALRDHDDFADERAAVLDALQPQVGMYVGTGEDAYAGSHGKLVAALQTEGRDPASYAEEDLVARLEGLVHTEDDGELGRAKDTWDPANEMGADYSNAIGQAWAVRALTGADSDVADEATTFLLRQQCDDGFFRLLLESKDHSCDGGTAEESAPSVDATAFSVLALLAAREAEVDGVEGVDTALEEAAAWLTEVQADDGSFADPGNGQGAGLGNANSTGVAAEALLALGEEEAATEAARWLAEHQVQEDAAATLAEEAGAVAFDDAAMKAAVDEGLTQGTRPQWQRATAQSVVALGALGS
jgi:hypothetical protein